LAPHKDAADPPGDQNVAPKRPRDFSQAAKLVIDVGGYRPGRGPRAHARGTGQGWGAVALGRKGGVARATRLTRKNQFEIAKKAAADCVVNVRGDIIVKIMLTGDFGCKRCRL
jgi:hypothetical protein